MTVGLQQKGGRQFVPNDGGGGFCKSTYCLPVYWTSLTVDLHSLELNSVLLINCKVMHGIRTVECCVCCVHIGRCERRVFATMWASLERWVEAVAVPVEYHVAWTSLISGIFRAVVLPCRRSDSSNCTAGSWCRHFQTLLHAPLYQHTVRLIRWIQGRWDGFQFIPNWT